MDAAGAGLPIGGRWLVPLLLVALVTSAVAVRTWNASVGLHGGETFDERFSVPNVAALLAGKGLRPKLAFYPSLSYLPQTAVLFVADRLHRATGLPALAVRTRRGGLSPTAYLLCRLTNVAFGGASLVLVFVVGRRLFGDAEGLAAAAVLAAFRRHVVSSAHFKPDILVLLLTLLVFHWTLLAAWRPRRRAYLRAGVGVGLATAAKYTGAGAAIALVAAALARFFGWPVGRDRRQLGWLVLAGLAAIVTFLALNPWVGDLFRGLAFNEEHYARAGAGERSSHWVVLQREVLSVLQHHGWTAWFVVAGLVALVWRLARPAAGGSPATTSEEWSDRQRLGVFLLLAQTGGYGLAHAAVFPLFRAQNILPVAPFTSLIAGWAMVEAYRRLARAWLGARQPAFAVTVWSLVALSLAAKPLAEVYQRAVPTTAEVAAEALASRLGEPGMRSLAYGGAHRRLALAAGRLGLVTFRAGVGSAAGPTMPWLADAEALLAGPPPAGTDALPRRNETMVVRQRPFASRGDTVTVILHPWRLVKSETLPLAPAVPGRLVAGLPADLPGSAVSFSLWQRRSGAVELRLEPGSVRLPLEPTLRRRNDQLLATRRFLLPPGARRVEIPAPPPSARPPRLELHRWRQQAPP